ncbi:Sialate O-acetylesterase [Trichinella spiralis]|uniref:Sialate O-acetylesterase n=1 Tax=Trichinella spiralis TaxID=6334 RepID=A0ABR3KW41_TRISP
MSQKRCLESWQSRHVAVSNDKSESNIGQTQYTPHWNECQAEASCSLTGCSSSIAAWNSAMHEQAAPIYRLLVHILMTLVYFLRSGSTVYRLPSNCTASLKVCFNFDEVALSSTLSRVFCLYVLLADSGSGICFRT